MRSTTKFEIKIIAEVKETDEEKVNIMKLYEKVKALFNVQNYIISDRIDIRRVNGVD